MKLLAIETSCDETALSLVETEDYTRFTILGNALLSQADTHREFGGVYPAMAKREHAKNLVPLFENMLTAAHAFTPSEHNQLSKDSAGKLKNVLEREPELFARLIPLLARIKKPDIDYIAVTNGPGLEPALWVGINFAKALSLTWDLPLIPVNHMEGHIYSSVLQKESETIVTLPDIAFPALSLLISGGHTELVLIKKWGSYEVMGATRDDAVGEAFDKVARMLDLPYPGGPEISKHAEAAREKQMKLEKPLPRPMIDSDDLDFSFSGLKTAVLYRVKGKKLTREDKEKLARGFEDAALDVLMTKTKRALEKTCARALIIGGGVSANKTLRERFLQFAGMNDITLYIPELSLTTDNALMIAIAGTARGRAPVPSSEIVAAGTLSLTN